MSADTACCLGITLLLAVPLATTGVGGMALAAVLGACAVVRVRCPRMSSSRPG